MSTPSVSGERIRSAIHAKNARHTWADRESFVIELAHEGVVGRGEAAPLPGYSAESLEEVVDALGRLTPGDLLSDARVALPASAEFALDAARREWRAQREGSPLCADGERALATLGDDASHAAFKRKLGRDLEAELRAAQGLREVHPEHELRFDGNGTLSVQSARSIEGTLVSLGASLLEEPVPFEELQRLSGFAVPLALDESLMHADGEERARRALSEGWVNTLVLKPSALGPSRCRALADIARQCDGALIVSHLFETALGHAAACAMALELGTETPQGLGRHVGVDAGPFESPLGLGGRLVAFAGSRYPVRRRRET